MNINKLLKKFWKFIEWTLFVILLALLFFVASPLLPTKTYVSTYVVSTGSMEPAIKTGSIVFSSSKDVYNIDDIIVFNSPLDQKTKVIHRITEKNETDGKNYYTTKGDNNEDIDNWLLEDSEIDGTLFFNIPYLGYAIDWLRTPFGFIFLLIVPAIFLSISQIKKIKDGINDEVEKRTKDIIGGKESNTASSATTILLFLLIGILSSQETQPVYALFSARASLTGMTISTGEIKPTVILNEIMWMGSTISEEDEWIELRNLTDEEIDISHWKIMAGVSGINGHIEIPHGYTIPANGYFLIANKYSDDKRSALNTNVDFRRTGINLDDDYIANGPLVLKDSNWEEIDRTPNSTIWIAGTNGEQKMSMQRDSDLNWYTCTNDLCNDTTYWDTEGNNYGTPGHPNL